MHVVQKVRLFFLIFAGTSCKADERLNEFAFNSTVRSPRELGASEVNELARRGLLSGEAISSATVYPAFGLGKSVVQVVVETADSARSYVVDEDGVVSETREFWNTEQAAHTGRYGKLSTKLYQTQVTYAASDPITVDIAIVVDLPEPTQPYDGTDLQTTLEEFESWTSSQSKAQADRVDAAKHRVLRLLSEHEAAVVENPSGLPIIRATVSAELLRSQELNASDVWQITELPTEQAELLSYAGRASMNAPVTAAGVVLGGLTGG